MPWPVTPDAPKTRAVSGPVVDSEVIAVVRSCLGQRNRCDEIEIDFPEAGGRRAIVQKKRRLYLIT